MSAFQRLRDTHPEAWERLMSRPVLFWTCPVREHRNRMDPKGWPVVTVQWDGDVASCTAPGCGRTSADRPERGPCPHCGDPVGPDLPAHACTWTDDHQPGRGCRFDAGDVPDGRHDDNRSDQ